LKQVIVLSGVRINEFGSSEDHLNGSRNSCSGDFDAAHLAEQIAGGVSEGNTCPDYGMNFEK